MSVAFGPERWAIEISKVLNLVLGLDHFPIDIAQVAREYSLQRFPEEPIALVRGETLPGFDGALYRAPAGKKGWGIFYNSAIQSTGRVNFTLRTPGEQELLVAGFAGWLNSLTGPVQITSRTAPADLTAQIGQLRAGASALPHPLLESAALGHADFLAQIGETGCLLHRTVLITARESDPAHATRAARRIANAAAALSAAEVDTAPLDPAAVRHFLNAAMDPDARDLNGA